jgi:hypothetical protein
MEGQAYIESVLSFKVEVSGSGSTVFWNAAPGTLVTEVIGHIQTALDAGTVDIGDEDTAALFIANTEWTETTVNQIASSKQTTLPDGKFYSAVKQLKVTVGGAATEGVVHIVLKFLQLTEMASQGYHNTVAVP